jgi:hypothetical protein
MDFGGGVFQIISTSGDTQTGGADVDNAIVDNLVNELKTQHGFDLRNDRMAMPRLKDAAERAKIELSNLFFNRSKPAENVSGYCCCSCCCCTFDFARSLLLLLLSLFHSRSYD